METTITSSNLLRLLSLAALSAILMVAPASAQKPWENDECSEFAGCSLCTWEDCEVIDCRDEEGAGPVRMECGGEN